MGFLAQVQVVPKHPARRPPPTACRLRPEPPQCLPSNSSSSR